MSKSRSIAEAVAAFGWPPFLPQPMAERYTGRSRWTFRRAVASGALQIAGRNGRSPVYRREDLDRWMVGDDRADAANLSPSPRRSASSTTTNAEAIARLRAITKPGPVNGNG